jgi:sigma-E factor negative regulatory protein RseC
MVCAIKTSKTMIEEEVVVATVTDGQVWVEKERKSACGACTHKCATGVIDDHLGGAKIRLQVISPIEVKTGDRVVVGVHESAIVSGSLWAYLVPLAGLFLGSILGKGLAPVLPSFSADGVSALCGILGLIATVILLKGSRVLSRRELHPVVIRKLN